MSLINWKQWDDIALSYWLDSDICEMGPTVYRPYPRRLESLTICWFNYKGSTFYSVILRPWVLVRPESNSRPSAHSPMFNQLSHRSTVNPWHVSSSNKQTSPEEDLSLSSDNESHGSSLSCFPRFLGVQFLVSGLLVSQRYRNFFNFAISSSFLSLLSASPNRISTSSGVEVMLLSRKDFAGETSVMFVLLLVGHVTSTSKIKREDEEVCCMTSCQFDERRATKPIFVAQTRSRSTFCNNCLQPATSAFVARQVDHAKRKRQNIGSKLAKKQCCVASWVFLCLVFRCLKQTSEIWLSQESYLGLQITSRVP